MEPVAQPQPRTDSGGPGLEDYDPVEGVLFLIRNARSLSAATFLGACLGLAVAQSLKNEYRAEARVVMPIGGAGTLQLPGLSSRAADMGFELSSTGGTDKRLFEQIVKSRSVADSLISRFELAKLYADPNVAPDELRAAVGRRLSAEAREGILRITYVDSDADRAAAICNAAVELLRSNFLGLQTSNAHTRRVFLENRLAKVHTELRQAEDEQKRFKLDSNVFEPQEQARASLTVMSSLLTELSKETVEAKVLELSSGESTGPLLQARKRIEELRAQLTTLETDSAPGSPVQTRSALPMGALLPLRALPGAEVGLSRAVRRVTILEQLALLLTRESETAYIQEVNDVNSLLVLDSAVPPSRKSYPSRTLFALGFAAAGFLLGAVRSRMREKLRKLAALDPARAENISEQLGFLARLL